MRGETLRFICLYHVSVDGFNGGSDSYLQFGINKHPVPVSTTFEWNCQLVVVSRIWCGIAAGQFYLNIHFE